jgi:SAM-dependent methyltransferase
LGRPNAHWIALHCTIHEVYPDDVAQERLWNANTHYYGILLAALPSGAQRVLDVGCGDGLLAAQLVQAGHRNVVAIDTDPGVLHRAKTRHAGKAIAWMQSNVFDPNVASDGLYDAVLSVATLHHMDAAAGLSRFAELVRPGGLVGVIGLAANDWWGLPYAAFGQFVRRAVSVRRGYWEHSAPMAWPPPATYRDMKRIGLNTLPGAHFRRHFYSRYSLLWTKPPNQ